MPTRTPWPPAIEVPPMKTAAMTGRSMPCPWVGKNTLISRVRSSPAKAAITPFIVKSLIRVASTLIPITRATSALSPMNMMASPNLCRFRMNQKNTASPSAQSAWTGKIPNRRPTKIVWIVVLDDRLDVDLEPAREQDRDPVPEELRGEGGHDRGHAQPRHEQAVDVADQRAGGESQDEADPAARGGVLKNQVKTNPESATTAGKLRSISPAVMTKVSPMARTSMGGTVCRNDM